jgi:hypothetical protein
MSKLRYRLVDQVHFLAKTERHPTAVVTLQRWVAPAAKKTACIYVRTENGVEITRHFCTTESDLAHVDLLFDKVRAEFADTILSEDAAGDEVARRGGPKPTWCTKSDCGAIIPFAASACAMGCPADSVSRVEFLSVSQRRATMTVVTGGKK